MLRLQVIIRIINRWRLVLQNEHVDDDNDHDDVSHDEDNDDVDDEDNKFSAICPISCLMYALHDGCHSTEEATGLPGLDDNHDDGAVISSSRYIAV